MTPGVPAFGSYQNAGERSAINRQIYGVLQLASQLVPANAR